MAVIVMTSAAGAPGVTTSALTLALNWPRRALLVEADPAGSSLVPGWLGGAYDGTRSLLNVAVGISNRQRVLDLITAQQVSAPEPFEQSRATFLLGWLNPAQAQTASGMWGEFGAAFSALHDAEVDVIVDAGRATQGSWPVELLHYADQVVICCRGTHVSSVRTAPTLNALRGVLTGIGAEERLSLLVVGERDATGSEIAKSLQARLAATLPMDPKAAQVFSDGWSGSLLDASASRPKKLFRSALWGQSKSAAIDLHRAAQQAREFVAEGQEDRS